MLDDLLYPLAPGSVVGYRNLARFENRVIVGDPTKDDDELLSGRVYSDFSGGCGVYDEREGADTGTFWDSQGLDVDHPGQLALLPAVQSFTIGGTTAKILGSATNVYASFDKNVYLWDESTDAFTDTTHNLAFEPVNKAVTYDDFLWVPYGANGYEKYSGGSGATTGTAGITPVAFCEWDNKLVAIEHDGQLSIYDALTDEWDSPATAILNSSITPRDVISYFNRSDEPSLYVVTTDGLYAYDPGGFVFIKTNLQYPRHPDNGKGAAVWRVGETLHVASSLGIYAWTGPGGTAAPVGLDRKQGIPSAYQGKIVDLTATLNHLYALIDGETSGGFHALYRFNGIGWSRVWAHTNNTATINWAMATGSNSTQRIWWDAGNTLYSMLLPRSYANARETVASGTGNYGTTGYLITSWFDANMEGFDKLFSYLLTNVQKVAFGSGENVSISYQDDYTDTSWTSLAFAAFEGTYWWAMNFSSPRIRFKVTVNSDTSSLTPIVQAFVAKYMKVPTSYGTWQVTLGLNQQGEWGVDASGNARDAQSMANELEDLLTKRSIITLEHNQNRYNVRLSNLQGWDGTAEDRRKSRTITLVEVPYPGDQSFAAAGA